MRDVLSWSFPIGQLFGIMIRVHFVLPLVMLGLVGRFAVNKDYPAGAWQDMAMLMGLMFISILLHELGHCFAARYMDGEADEVLLWPLGGLAFCRWPGPESDRPKQGSIDQGELQCRAISVTTSSSSLCASAR